MQISFNQKFLFACLIIFVNLPNSIKKAKELEKHSTHNFQVEAQNISDNMMEEVHALVQYHEKSLKQIKDNIDNNEKNLLVMTIIGNQRLNK